MVDSGFFLYCSMQFFFPTINIPENTGTMENMVNHFLCWLTQKKNFRHFNCIDEANIAKQDPRHYSVGYFFCPLNTAHQHSDNWTITENTIQFQSKKIFFLPKILREETGKNYWTERPNNAKQRTNDEDKDSSGIDAKKPNFRPEINKTENLGYKFGNE